MTAEAALPSHAWQQKGSILTFIVPTAMGCDLACPFCFIAQREEQEAKSILSPEDYTEFVKKNYFLDKNIACICIQGYEPLLSDSFPYTRAILSTGKWLNIPTSLVTNGTHLAQWADELRALAPGRVSVSLDAAEAEAHDRQRRKIGAFVSTVAGLRRAATVLPAATELVVTSVLIPKRRAQLDAMPELLNDIGVKHWVVTALQKVRTGQPGGPVGERESILADLRILSERARRVGIDFKVDDEFAGLGSSDESELPERLRIRRLQNPDGVYRLVPDGRCSKGSDILKPLTDLTPRWSPKTMDAGVFLQSLSSG